jgi:toxin ParE1/3/4
VNIVWTERSVASLEAIGDFIAIDDPKAAARWLARLVKRTEAIAALPHGGRIVPEVGRDDVREVFVRTYRIVYQVREDAIYILTVFNGRRLLHESDLDDLIDDD